MAKLTVEDVQKVCSLFLSEYPRELVLDGESYTKEIKRLIALEDQKTGGIKGLFSKKKASRFSDSVLCTFARVGLDDERIQKIACEILKISDGIHCVIGSQIIIFQDKFAFVNGVNEFTLTFRECQLPIEEFFDIVIDKSYLDRVNGEELYDYELTLGRCSDSPEACFGGFDNGEKHVEAVQNLMGRLREYLAAKAVAELGARKKEINNEFETESNGLLKLQNVEPLEGLLREYQKKIIEIDRAYVQNFVKTIQFLKKKSDNIQKIFAYINEINDIGDVNEFYDLLADEKYKYELILMHSISMLVALVDEDMVTFYEVYELFDKFGIFNSQWENDTSAKLDGIKNSINSMERNMGRLLKDILYQTQKMEATIVGAIDNLTYVTSSGFVQLDNSINTKLTAINSNVRTGNLLTAIQLYQQARLK